MSRVRRSAFGRYAVAVLIIGAVILLRWVMRPLVGAQSPYVVFLPGVMLSAWFGGFGPGLLATVLAALAADLLFIGPIGDLFDQGFPEMVRTHIFVADGLLISWMASRLNTAVLESREKKRELEEADRRKDEFVAILAHELRSPLAPLMHGIELLGRAEKESPDLQRETIGMMHRQVRLMSRLVEDLLDVARIRRGEVPLRIETLALDGIVSQAVELCQPQFDDRGQRFSVELPDEPLWVEGDPLRLTQVLTNLLTNASKYTPPGGRVRLQVAAESNRAVFRVIDNGIGISAERLPHIFELFQQGDHSTEQAQSGLGLGLAVVHTLVRLHGGEITAASHGPGRGSEFTVRLPLAKEPEERAAESKAPGREEIRPLRLLIVEDSPDAAKALASLLRFDGHEVEIASDGPQALRTAESWRPDVILLDISLPGMDGFEIARRLRSDSFPYRPLVIATTGHAREDDVRRAREAGFDHYLVKPVRIGELQDLLHSPTAVGASAIRA